MNTEPLAELKQVSSSEWDERHLKACHVIISLSDAETLPFLEGQFGHSEKNIKQGQGRIQTRKFLDGLNKEHSRKVEAELVHTPEVGVSLAQIWAALNDLRQDDTRQGSVTEVATDTLNASPLPPRERKAVVRQGFVDPTEIISSSPPASGQEPPSSIASQSWLEPTPSAAPVLEDYTVHLAFSVLRHVL